MNGKLAMGGGSLTFGFAMWGWLCLVISLVGFWPSYIAPLAGGTYSSPSRMMLWHVLSSVVWLAFMISQPWLIQVKKVNLHRQIGWFGVLVATGVVVTGIIVSLK